MMGISASTQRRFESNTEDCSISVVFFEMVAQHSPIAQMPDTMG